MRKTVPMRIGELWGDFLKNSPGLARKFAEARIPEAWASVVGPALAGYTMDTNFVKGVLYVKMASAPARSEIFMQREQLRLALNKTLGLNVINVLIVK